jgi:hypothetical protein
MPVKATKRFLRATYNEWLFQKAFGQIRKLQLGETPRTADLADLQIGWGNSGWSGDATFLQAACWFASTCDGPIVECGSGLSTIILSAIPRRPRAELYTFEHIEEWQKRVSGKLADLHLSAKVIHAPLHSYGEFDWYSVPESLPSNFSLAICDGPPSQTKGGRYGLLPVLGERLSSALILLDDAERDAEQEMIARWQKEFGHSVRYMHSAEGSIAVMMPRPK